jgi:hypothetical protein
VKFTNEAGVAYDALVLYVHAGEPKPLLDLTHVEQSVHLPSGPSVPIQRFQIPHKDQVTATGKPYWTETA